MTSQSNEREHRRDRQIDAALATYPVAPLPQNFTSQVMAQVDFTQQERLQAAPVASPGPLGHDWGRALRLYAFELASSILLTLGLGIGVAWPLFAQTGLLPTRWASTPLMNVHLETIFTYYFSSWAALGIGGVILLELGMALVAWVTWMEEPPLQAR